MSGTIPSRIHVGVGGSRKKKKKGGRDRAGTLFYPTPLIFKRLFYKKKVRGREKKKKEKKGAKMKKALYRVI